MVVDMRKLMTILVGIALLFSVSGIVGGQIDCTQCAKDGMKLAERHGISVYPCHDGHNSTSWVRFLQFPNKWAGKPAIIKDQHMILETKLPAGAKYTVYNVTRNFTLGPEVGSASSEDGLVTLVVGGKTYRATFRRFTVWYIAYFPASDFVRTTWIP